jgi:hypothetical protein
VTNIETGESHLQASRTQCHTLQNQLDAAATVIAALGAENATLRRQAADFRARAVIPRSRSGKWLAG